jgi:hypothetical protein
VDGGARDNATSRVGFDCSVRDNVTSRVGFDARVLLGGPVQVELDEISRVGFDSSARDRAASRVGFESARGRAASRVRFDSSVRDDKASSRFEGSPRDRATSGIRERAASRVRSFSSHLAASLGFGSSPGSPCASAPTDEVRKVKYSERVARARGANQSLQKQAQVVAFEKSAKYSERIMRARGANQTSLKEAKAFSVSTILKKNNQYNQRMERAREANTSGKASSPWERSPPNTPVASCKGSVKSVKDAPRLREERMMTAYL